MPEYTKNYNLIKPKKSENYDIDEVTGKNADIIDTELHDKVDKMPGKGLSTNDFTDEYVEKIKRMIEGTRGYSAYEIACQNGFEGDEQKWLESLALTYEKLSDEQKREIASLVEAINIKFSDGETYQQKYEKGEFKGNKGANGENAGFGQITANIDNNVGVPSVEVQASGENTAKNIQFIFKNLKGEPSSSYSTVQKISADSEAGATITTPKYKVGANVLDVYWNGLKLIKGTDNNTGHYLEVGSADTISSSIKITSDWNLRAGDVLEFIVKGEYE